MAEFSVERNFSGYTAKVTVSEFEIAVKQNLPELIFRGLVEAITEKYLEDNQDTIIESIKQHELATAIQDAIALNLADKVVKNLLTQD